MNSLKNIIRNIVKTSNATLNKAKTQLYSHLKY